MPRFFVSPDKVVDGKITIDTDDVGHIMRVLRMNCGDMLTVCDTCGNDYEAKISDVGDGAIICDIVTSSKSVSEPKTFVTLFQALPKSPKMEYIIQKTTELGISKIVPVKMSRCVMKWGKGDEKKTVRWQKICESAAKQSGRGIIPKITNPITFDEAVKHLSEYELSFAPYECEETNTLKSVISGRKVKTAAFIIGPEGGFDPTETEKLKAVGIKTITLGKRILRTETAGEAVLSMMMYEMDEI